ncbi:hypothetical protein [Streptomyces sp. NPDC006551]|uniref:hypothetical protein n=1 Tax=Streptomyces sp. NPDC006551 TaxID=3157178 RepID=UPI0033AF9FA6
MQQARGKRSVVVGGDAGIVVTGDHNQLVTAVPPVRSAYWEQVRRIAPVELVDRERELASLAAFCLADSGPSYVWWRAEAWAGKTALMAWFALNPPPGVRIVPFFITARWGAQNDVVAYVDVVLEQLAELAGEGIPAHLTASTREAHLLRLQGEAARACAERGERLVLLVDGLDEDRGVTTGPDAHSIASLLPISLPTIVSGRLNPPVPVDVPAGHPLRDPAVVRTLEPSPSARAIRAEAERELKRLLEAGGLEHDLLALLTAAGGGLTADDLAELTGAVPYRVRDVLRTGPGRTFAARSDAYLLAHEELQAQAVEMLGRRELDRYRRVLHAWAEEWQARDWPAETPDYLLRGYFSMLRAAGDVERMVGCALDSVRHDRLLEATGGDIVALDEVRLAEEAFVGAGVPDLVDLVRLVIRREELVERNDRIPRTLPWAWAALGRTGRAEALARSIPSLDWRALALVDVAAELAARGGAEDARRVLEDAEAAARRYTDAFGDERDTTLAEVSRAWVGAGLLDRAEDVARAVDDPYVRARLLPELAHARARQGEEARARALCLSEADDRVRALGLAAVARARATAGDAARAVRSAVTEDAGSESLALAVVSGELRRAGDRAAADEALARLDAVLCVSPVLTDVVGALADAGEYDRAAAAALLHPDPEERGWAQRVPVIALAAAGEIDRAWELAGRIEHAPAQASARLGVAAGAAGSGAYERAEELARTIDDQRCRERALNRVVAALAGAGETERAERLARDCAHETDADDPMVFVVEALAAAGHFARARSLAAAIAHDDGAFALVRGAVTAAVNAGAADVEMRARAAEVVEEVESRIRARSGGGTLDPVHTPKVLVEAGYLDQARTLLDGIESKVLPTDGSAPESYESIGWQVRAGFAVEALAWAGEFDRATALARRITADPSSSMARLVLVERLSHAGRFAPALALVEEETRPGVRDQLRLAMAKAAAAAGDWEAAESYTGQLSLPGMRLMGWARIAAERARAGHHAEADTALAKALVRDVRDEGTSLDFTDVVRALFLLGRYEEGDTAIAELVEHAVPWFFGGVVSALVEAGEYDRARSLVAGLDDRGKASGSLRCGFIEDLVEAGEEGRAADEARLARDRGTDDGRGPLSVWPALALAIESERGRVPLARQLRDMNLMDALHAFLRLEPRTVPVVVDALRRPRQV